MGIKMEHATELHQRGCNCARAVALTEEYLEEKEK